MTRRELIGNVPALIVGACAWPKLLHGRSSPAKYLTHTVDVEFCGRTYAVVLTWLLTREADGTMAVVRVEDMFWSCQPAYAAEKVRRYRSLYPSMSFASANEAEAAVVAVERAEQRLFTAKPGDNCRMRVKSYSLPNEWVEACRYESVAPLQ